MTKKTSKRIDRPKVKHQHSYKPTRARFIFSFIAMLLALMCLIIGASLIFRVYTFESMGISMYGVISPALFFIATGIFQIGAFFLRHNKSLWKTATLFSMICSFGAAASFAVVFVDLTNPIGTFVASMLLMLPMTILQALILKTNIHFHSKSEKTFDIARGKKRGSFSGNKSKSKKGGARHAKG